MSFFIPGKTTCPICAGPIGERSEAARLPFVEADAAPSLEFATRPFVHRACWTGWSHAHAVSRSAFRLLAGAAERGELEGVVDPSVGLVVEWVDALGSYRWHDPELLAVLELRPEDVPDFRSFLASASEAGDDLAPEPFVSGAWRAWEEGGAVRLALESDGEVVERLTIPANKCASWLALLGRLEDAARAD